MISLFVKIIVGFINKLRDTIGMLYSYISMVGRFTSISFTLPIHTNNVLTYRHSYLFLSPNSQKQVIPA